MQIDTETDLIKNLLFQRAAREGDSEQPWFCTRSNRYVLQGLSRRRCFTEHDSTFGDAPETQSWAKFRG